MTATVRNLRWTVILVASNVVSWAWPDVWLRPPDTLSRIISTALMAALIGLQLYELWLERQR